MSEQDWRDVIISYKSELSNLTEISVRLLHRCREFEIITTDNVNVIETIQLNYEKVSKFYDIIWHKDETCFQNLVSIMEETDTRQSDDVLNILRLATRAPVKNNSSPRPSSTCSANIPRRSHVSGPAIWFEVKEPISPFVKREDELVELHKLVSTNEGKEMSTTMMCQITCLHGLGGVGKTTIARVYARTYTEYFDGNIIWINADTVQTMENSFKCLAKLLYVNWIGKKSMADILTYFSNQRSLFIFDNVEEYKGEVDQFLPCDLKMDVNKPYILLTSRKAILPQKIKNYKLDVLKPEDAREFIKSELKLENNDDANLLAMQLQYLPLALQQAISYIKKLIDRYKKHNKTKNPLEEYIKLLHESNVDVIDFEYYEETADDYCNTIFRTWTVTTNTIEKNNKHGELALKIMKILSYLDPDNITVKMFEQKFNENNLEDSLELLEKYSMIEINNGFIIIHRLVQQVIRIRNKMSKCDLEVLKDCLSLMQRDSLEHFYTIWKYALSHNDLVREFSWVGIRLCDNIYFGHQDSVEIFNNTLTKFNEVLKPNEYSTMELYCIGIINFCNDLDDPNCDKIFDLDNQLMKRIEVSKSLSLAHDLPIQRLANSLRNLGKSIKIVSEEYVKSELVQRALSYYKMIAKFYKLKSIENELISSAVKDCCTFLKIPIEMNTMELRIENLSLSEIFTQDFIVRMDEVKKLHQLLKSTTEKQWAGYRNLERSYVNIVGPNGIGKTSLVINYIKEYSHEYKNVIWINCETKESMHRSIEQVCKKFNIPVTVGGTAMSQDAMTYFKFFCWFQDISTLFLFDNIHDYRMHNNRYMHRILYDLSHSTSGFNTTMLLLSTHPLEGYWILDIECKFVMTTLNEVDAMKFICKSLKITDIHLANSLALKIKCFPLAIHYAVKYLNKYKTDLNISEIDTSHINTYLQQLKDMVIPIEQRHNYMGEVYTETVIITWNIAKLKLQSSSYGADAIKIIKKIAYFDPENISVEIIDAVSGLENIFECVQLLENYGMVRIENSRVSIHRLLQKIIRKEDKTLGYETLLDLLINGNFNSDDGKIHLVFLWRGMVSFKISEVSILIEILKLFKNLFGQDHGYVIKLVYKCIISLNHRDCPNPEFLVLLCEEIIKILTQC